VEISSFQCVGLRGKPTFWWVEGGYYVQAQIAIVMYDNTRLNSHVKWVTREECVSYNTHCICVNSFEGALSSFHVEDGIFHLNLSKGEGFECLFEHLMTL